VNFLVLLNVYANDFYSDALGVALNFDSQMLAANALSPFQSFFSSFLPNLLGMWPVQRAATCSNINQNSGVIACYSQPVLFMHGSLDSDSIPQGFVNNVGTVSAVNAKTASVFLDNVGHTIFYTASASVWSFLQQNAASNYSGISAALPPPSAVVVDWEGGVVTKFPSNNFWCKGPPPAPLLVCCEVFIRFEGCISLALGRSIRFDPFCAPRCNHVCMQSHAHAALPEGFGDSRSSIFEWRRQSAVHIRITAPVLPQHPAGPKQHHVHGVTDTERSHAGKGSESNPNLDSSK
jgi:hypothetical protein